MTSGLLMGQGSEVRDTFGFDSRVHGGPVHEMGKWRENKVSGNVKGSVRLCWFETSIRREWQPSGMHEPGARGGILRPRDGAAPCRRCRRSGGGLTGLGGSQGVTAASEVSEAAPRTSYNCAGFQIKTPEEDDSSILI